jgi:tetratricopeptide (TPR) repeat protein
MFASLRAKGNEAFNCGRFEEALTYYNKIIESETSEEIHLIYSNRSTTFLKLGKYDEALRDAYQCVKIKPNFAKGRQFTVLFCWNSSLNNSYLVKPKVEKFKCSIC